jgi:ABC-2 type transport system ATP-binding protein
MTIAMSTQSLSRRFGRTLALNHIDLGVPEGAVYALVGANGAGKTTLIKVLMNIMRPTSGTAQVFGLDSHKVTGKIFQRIGYVSENQELPEWMTVAEMLAYYRRFYPIWDQSLQQKLSRQFDLPLNRKLKQLSRGVRMKAAFVGSLSFHPALIVLDEPFSGLDPMVRNELVECLKERAPATTVFLSSHDLDEIESFSNHLGFLQQGRLLFSEAMSVLSNRFREVTVTLPVPTSLASDPPPAWQQIEAQDSVLHFVHNHYDEASSRAEIAALLPMAHTIQVEPMSLRSIFLSIAKSARVEDLPASQPPAGAARVDA